jgi:hypothetical protein
VGLLAVEIGVLSSLNLTIIQDNETVEVEYENGPWGFQYFIYDLFTESVSICFVFCAIKIPPHKLGQT